MIEK
ncbi:hypothetical protein CLOM_g12806, partial [Closterium sp. NIES-68]|jgi:hypothetical protein